MMTHTRILIQITELSVFFYSYEIVISGLPPVVCNIISAQKVPCKHLISRVELVTYWTKNIVFAFVKKQVTYKDS